MWMIVFLILPFLGVAYCAWHVWMLLPLARLWRLLIVGLGIGSFLLMFLNFSRAIDRMPMPIARLCYDIGNSSLFVMLYLTMLFLLLDMGRLVHVVPRHWLHQNVYSSVVIAGGLFMVFLLGNIHYNNKVRKTIRLTTTKPLFRPAPAASSATVPGASASGPASAADVGAGPVPARPLRIVMMSDLHLGYHNPRRELARWVDMVNAERPDVVLIAGDIIDMSIRPLIEEDMAAELRRIGAPVYACLGNHEYYSGEPLAQQFYRDAGIHLLRDTFAIISSSHPAVPPPLPSPSPGSQSAVLPPTHPAGLLIIGRDDRTNRHRKTLERIMTEAKETVPGEYYTILLDHQPYDLEQAEKASVDFQLSGHTHRGQVWPISRITDRLYECSWGEWQRGATRYYISSGIGIWGGKFRIGTQSEYVVAELEEETFQLPKTK